MNEDERIKYHSASVAEARSRGLPEGWTLELEGRRRRWRSPKPNNRLFDSLSKALGHAKVPTTQSTSSHVLPVKRKSERMRKKRNPYDDSDADASTSTVVSVNTAAMSWGGRIQHVSIANSEVSSISKGSVDYDTVKDTISNTEVVSVADEDPETDPETALVCPKHERSQRVTTVHWNPESEDGRLVGFKIRIFDLKTKKWKEGRVLRFDPGSYMHKISFFENELQRIRQQKKKDDILSGEGTWVWINEEVVECFGAIVWALVKGFAWWPAQILDVDINNPSTKVKEGYALVKFFGSNELATIKNVPDFIRPFLHGLVDSVIQKCRKKLNAKATALAKEEEDVTIIARNQAVLYYAEKAFKFALQKAHGLLGKRVEFFRSDINYPTGKTVQGVVRSYSPTSKKWLLSFDVNVKKPPGWFNIETHECNLNILNGNKKSSSSDKQPKAKLEDLVPFCFGVSSSSSRSDHFSKFKDCCTACLEPIVESNNNVCVLQCHKCHHQFHAGCLDPPLTTRAAQKILESDGGDGDTGSSGGSHWICDKCTPCVGCGKLDIAFGCKVIYPPPPTLQLPTNNGKSCLELCSMCVPLYEKECFCPNCGFSWDDKKYERTMGSLRLFHKERSALLSALSENEIQESGAVDKNNPRQKQRLRERNKPLPIIDTTAEGVTPQPKLSKKVVATEDTVKIIEFDTVDPSWFRPRTDPPVWGFNNLSMLLCDSCNLWVHAGCAQLTEEEYTQTNIGQHPVYSIEFLCRVCCKKRCIAIIEALQNEDAMLLFAIPVTEDVAPTYYDTIKNPMDLTTMIHYAQKETYYNYTWLRESFDLMVLNALTFNTPNSKYWYEAKRFHQLCLDKVFSSKAKAASSSKYYDSVLLSYKKAEKMLLMEIDRIKQDESTLKKDLVVGASLAKVEVPKSLTKPSKEFSCVRSADLRLKPKEALFHSWMECCFSCGSSGAPDTMLFCVDCAEAYHAFCVNAPIHSMSPSSVSGWRCPNCKLCEITGVVPHDDSRLLYCEMCDRAFTLDLLDPPLTSVPSDLFICGQCVDCQSCHHEGDKGKVSRKYWSGNPRLCYRCHGCKGLVEKQVKGMDCPVCGRLSRKGDVDIIKCRALSCTRFVHASCDPVAASILTHEEKDTMITTFKCIKCRKPVKKSKLPLKKIKPPKEDTSQDPNAWKVLDPYRNDYNCILSDALKLYHQMKLRNHIHILKEATPNLPTWMLARAARYIRIRKRCTHKKNRNNITRNPENTPIVKLYRDAVTSAGFIVVACHVLGLNIWSHAKSFDIMPSFLIAPDKDMDCVHLPKEVLEAGSAQFSFLKCETESRDTYIDNANDEEGKANTSTTDTQEDTNMPPLGVEAVTEEQSDPNSKVNYETAISSPTNQCQKSNIDDSTAILARPLLGWNEILDKNECKHQWRDPRMCVLCHTCGDDDADVVLEDNSTIPDENKSSAAIAVTTTTDDNEFELLDVGKCGRLLPFLQHGYTSWVHSACALWSSEVWENELGEVHAVEKARSRGAKLKCYGCGRAGATLGCHKNNCGSNYHFPCAVACGAIFTANRQIFCRVHRESAQSPQEANIEQMRVLKVNAVDHQLNPDVDICYRIGTLVIHALGEIEQDYDGFHSESFITPPGFMASRIFWSYCTERKRVLYVLAIERSDQGKPVFSITAADDPSCRIQGCTADKGFNELLDKVLKINESLFSTKEDLYSALPMTRLENRRGHPLLSTSQFWGFGLNKIRQALENLPGVEALVVPFSEKSKSYKFCYHLPSEDKVTELQRNRAAKAAEKDLTNSSGSARTEGMSGLDRTGSGRITLALVRHAVEELTCTVVEDAAAGSSTSKGKNSQQQSTKRDHDTIQSMFYEMKSIPLDKRLAALRSHIHGWGLFTKIDISKDSMIIEYTGEIVRQCIADKRERGYEMSGIGSCYMFRLDQQRIVDATMIGCMARYMNHSCCANAYAKIVNIDADQIDKKIIVFANKDINAGEEITYDYKFPVEDGSLRCTCGAANCIGRLN